MTAQQIKTDWICPILTARMAATLGVEAPKSGNALPHLWHWMFFQPQLPAHELGQDGHPALHDLPEAMGRQRMWAGGRFEFNQPLIIGQTAQCRTTLDKMEEKQGQTGALLFVTLKHEYQQNDTLCLTEWQQIVYREPSPPKLDAPTMPEATWLVSHEPDSTQLFRYSAVTFNGHRIHYDHPYATEIEGYAGLVIHGPMMATWALHACFAAYPERTVKTFSFRGIRPATLPNRLIAGGRLLNENVAEVWIGNEQGLVQSGKVEWLPQAA